MVQEESSRREAEAYFSAHVRGSSGMGGADVRDKKSLVELVCNSTPRIAFFNRPWIRFTPSSVACIILSL